MSRRQVVLMKLLDSGSFLVEAPIHWAHVKTFACKHLQNSPCVPKSEMGLLDQQTNIQTFVMAVYEDTYASVISAMWQTSQPPHAGALPPAPKHADTFALLL
ncbi:hypothetical protein PABG_06533 [Paracoccidioides brasiliensis Pb03]|nr:hypothetical protein PABG_06533 [Paracoccidioides brasiliensis Pb03]